MKSQVEQLLDKYRPLGIVKAGELLLQPNEALRLADELEAIGVPIIGVDIWYYVGNNIAEDPAGLDLSDKTGTEPAVSETVAAAKHYIRHRLPNHAALVSFVIDDNDWWKTVA